MLAARRREPLRPRPEGPRAARPARVRRGRRRWPTGARRAGPDGPEGAYLKVTIAEAPPRLRGRGRRARGGSWPATARGEDRRRAASNDRVFLVHLGFAYQQLGRSRDAAEAFGRAKRVGGDPDAALLGLPRGGAAAWPRTSTRRWPRRAPPARASPTTRDLACLEATVLREKGDTKAALALVEKLRQQVARRTRRCWSRWPTSTSAPSSSRRRPTRCARRGSSSPRACATLFQLGRGARAPEAPRRGRGGRSARRCGVEPDSAPSSTTSAT